MKTSGTGQLPGNLRTGKDWFLLTALDSKKKKKSALSNHFFKKKSQCIHLKCSIISLFLYCRAFYSFRSNVLFFHGCSKDFSFHFWFSKARQTIEKKNQQNHSWLLKNINKTGKPLARWAKGKKRKDSNNLKQEEKRGHHYQSYRNTVNVDKLYNFSEMDKFPGIHKILKPT